MGIAAGRLPHTDTEAMLDDNKDTEVRTEPSPLETFEAAAVAALRAGYTIDDLTPWLLSAIDQVAGVPLEPPSQ
jgi:hypothetical protein